MKHRRVQEFGKVKNELTQPPSGMMRDVLQIDGIMDLGNLGTRKAEQAMSVQNHPEPSTGILHIFQACSEV